MNLVIDIGNTLTKVALFDQNQMISKKIHINFTPDDLHSYLRKEIISHVIISSVNQYYDIFMPILEQSTSQYILLNAHTPIPISNHYKSPNTLGMDRLSNVIGSVSLCPESDVLAIDAGTCITYDFIDKDKNYLGGAISPGIKMRYKALHEHTARLPLLDEDLQPKLIGDDTNSSIHSGVINGTLMEIKGIIQSYQSVYKELKVFITGGDLKYFDKIFKINIFANPNLLLIGLNQILAHNFEK